MEYLTAAALSASLVVVIVQEAFKLKVVPGTFANRWPVPTNIVLSTIATLFIVPIKFDLENLPQLAVQVGTVAVVAAIAYNQLIEQWVKPAEGPSV